MLKIPKDLQNQLIELSRRDSPIETCGYLAGNEAEIKTIFPLANVDHSPEHFSFDPVEQFQTVKSARNQGLELLGVYHSHPASPARLSEEDLRFANDPALVYLIISLQEPEPVLKAFRVREGEITEVQILITDGESK